MSIVIVEGTDGSGKSTLIERARENQSSRYFIRTQASRYQPSLKIAFQYLNWIKHKPDDIPVIMDRFHFISDRVYGPILRKEDVFKDLPLNFGLQSVSAIIYCRPSREKIIENVNAGTHLAGVRSSIEDLISAYDVLMDKLKEDFHLPIYRYDYQEDEALSFWRHIFSEVKDREFKRTIFDTLVPPQEKKNV